MLHLPNFTVSNILRFFHHMYCYPFQRVQLLQARYNQLRLEFLNGLPIRYDCDNSWILHILWTDRTIITAESCIWRMWLHKSCYPTCGIICQIFLTTTVWSRHLIFPWSLRSPDIHPLDSCLCYLKAKMYVFNPQTVFDLKDTVICVVYWILLAM